MPFGIGNKKISKRDASVIAVVFGGLFIFLVIDFIRKIRQGEHFEDMIGHIIVTIGVAVVLWGMIAFLIAKPEEEEQETAAEDDPADEDLPDEELLEEPEEFELDGTDIEVAEGEIGSGEE